MSGRPNNTADLVTERVQLLYCVCVCIRKKWNNEDKNREEQRERLKGGCVIKRMF